MPFETTRWAGEQQHRQDHQRSGDERQQKCPEKTHSALDAAKSGEKAEYYVDDGFEHGAHSRRSSAAALRQARPLRSGWHTLARVKNWSLSPPCLNRRRRKGWFLTWMIVIPTSPYEP
jgi:hypothetical protein